MTWEDYPPLEDREAWIARFGEYRHIPLARYGSFRIDIERNRSPTTGERQTSPYEIVFEIDDCYELDLSAFLYLYRLFGPTAYGWPVPSRAQLLRIATVWWERSRPTPDGGMISLACYRRRIGPADDLHEMTPGDWYIGPLFRRPGDPMISMAEAAPFVEAALRQLELDAAEGEMEEPSEDF